jgi:hypothetical protein
MNMPTSIKPFIFAVVALVCAQGCIAPDPDITYEINDVNVLPPNTVKTKEKSPEQYISILYANLFQKALSADKLFEITSLIEANGDKEVINDVILTNFLNDPEVLIPSDSLMRAEVDVFIFDTYKRFLIREPSELEFTYFRNYINANSNVTTEMVYISFALSNEYYYY